MCPKNALVNGFFRGNNFYFYSSAFYFYIFLFVGNCPPQLSCLSVVDVSLISIICPIHRVSLLPKGCHTCSTVTTFAVVNDIPDVLLNLPRNPDVAGFALLRRTGDKNPKPLRYSPYRIVQALQWLTTNNVIYGNVEVLLDWLQQYDVDEKVDLNTIETVDEDYEEFTEDGNIGSTGPQVREFFLNKTEENYDIVQKIQLALGASDMGASGTPSFTRSNGDYAADYATDDFLQKAFPVLYPYGRGKYITLLALLL